MTTLRDIADAAGVSVATASRSLSGSDAVIDSTRDHVLRVAAELDYTPNRLGRNLATGSTGNVGVILPDVTNAFYTSFLAELEHRLGNNDIGILIGDSHESLDGERRLILRMLGQVDTLLLVSPRLPDDELVAAADRLPVVLANRLLDPATPRPPRLRQVALDVDQGFTDAIEHLHSLGHTRIAWVDGPLHSWSGQQKRSALQLASNRLGVTLTRTGTGSGTGTGTGRPDFTGGRDALSRIDLRECTAIIAFNDEIALGLLAALRERGIPVPEEVSVIGCDDSLADGMAWPALTTIDSSARALGRLAADAILTGTQPADATVVGRLVIRDSTGTARTSLQRELRESAQVTRPSPARQPTPNRQSRQPRHKEQP